MIRLCTVALVFLTGCGTIGGTKTVSVAVPVVCRSAEPDRPNMPTENLSVSDQLDTKIKALIAESVVRDGYEEQLRAALRACL